MTSANFEGPFYEVSTFRGRCQGHVFTMLKPHLAYIYFQMSQSSEIFKTESIRSKEYVYGVSNFWDPFGLSLDQVGTVFSLPLLLSIFLNNLVSLLVFSHTYQSFTVVELQTSGLALINHHVQCPSKVKQHTLAVYIKEQKMPQKSPQEPYLLECGGIRADNARKSFN